MTLVCMTGDSRVCLSPCRFFTALSGPEELCPSTAVLCRRSNLCLHAVPPSPSPCNEFQNPYSVLLLWKRGLMLWFPLKNILFFPLYSFTVFEIIFLWFFSLIIFSHLFLLHCFVHFFLMYLVQFYFLSGPST